MMNQKLFYWLWGGQLSYTQAAIAIFIGILPILFIHELPKISNSTIILLILFLFLIFIKVNRYIKFIALIMMALLWAIWHSNFLIEKINALSKTQHQLDITVISVPLYEKEKEKLKVRINKINNVPQFPPIYAMWQVNQPMHNLCSGQTWQLNGLLKPLHSSLNEGGFDQQRYSISQRIIGTLKVSTSRVIDEECSVRQKVINSYIDSISLLKNAGVTYALMFGERGMLSPELSLLLQTTGLSHLIAISGLHIGLSYLFGYWLAKFITYFFPVCFSQYIVPIVAGVACAYFYAWVSGFAIPAVRALIALVLWIYIKQQNSFYFPWQWAIWSIGLILVADPLAILSDSFWLSFFAVFAILYWLRLFPLSSYINYTKAIRWGVAFIHLQVGLLLLLAPIQIMLFQGINVMSFFANLWLVPIVSWLVIPLILLLFLLPFSFVQHIIFNIIDEIIEVGLKPLAYLSDYWFEMQFAPLFIFLFCWLIGLFIALGLYRYYIGLLGCLAALCIGTENTTRQISGNEWSLTLLDVGHGLAVVIEQKGLAYLYDTGNRWPEGSNAQRQIIPYLKRKKIIPIGVILSHDHLDHTGGVSALKKQYPWLNLRSSFSGAASLPCIKGQHWQWGKLNFAVLWPERMSKKSHNDDSCVIMLSDGYHKILLTGDLEKQGEQAISASYQQQLRSDILFAPHHGSNTSSTPLFIRMASPNMVLVSSARYSPWKIPSDKVHFRYKSNNIKWINTAEAGQVTIWFRKKTIELTRYRKEIHPRWYHLWFGDPQFPE